MYEIRVFSILEPSEIQILIPFFLQELTIVVT